MQTKFFLNENYITVNIFVVGNYCGAGKIAKVIVSDVQKQTELHTAATVYFLTDPYVDVNVPFLDTT